MAYVSKIPPGQETIRATCFHPSGTFVEFKKEEVEQSISDCFEKIASKYPERIAVRTANGEWTYDEVNRAANRVARAILRVRGKKNEPVLLLAEHGPGGIVSSLGILKAGKILVTADPSFPLERLAFMAADSRTAAILTENSGVSVANRLGGSEQRVINVDTLDGDLTDGNVNLRFSANQAAQIRYTSGTTGTPKGVIRSHRRNLYSVLLEVNAGHLCPDDRVLILRNISNSIKDVLTGLLVGSAVCLYDIKKAGFSKLADFITMLQITYYISTPSIFRYLMEDLDEGVHFPTVRMVRVGGEPLFRHDAELFKKHFPPSCVLMNHLGSNEAGGLCDYFITEETVIDTPIVPIGYAVNEKNIFLVDDTGREIETDEVGEIAVKSRYLSTGYWSDLELTNSKFVFGSDSEGETIYRTGDLARRLADGCLVYMGRKDDQVKIRGYKVQLREVEAVILEHPNVKQAAVVAWEGKPGEKSLTAYIVFHSSTSATVTELSKFLRKKLPEYMIPSAYVFLDSLPLSNGKLDRHALRKPGHRRPELQNRYIKPRSSVEARLAKIWEEILSLDEVGVHDNFFDLGGHSLTATRVVSQVIKRFQLEMPLQVLFQSPTIADMAAAIETQCGQMMGEAHLERVLAELESLSEEEARRLIAEESEQPSRGKRCD